MGQWPMISEINSLLAIKSPGYVQPSFALPSHPLLFLLQIFKTLIIRVEPLSSLHFHPLQPLFILYAHNHPSPHYLDSTPTPTPFPSQLSMPLSPLILHPYCIWRLWKLLLSLLIRISCLLTRPPATFSLAPFGLSLIICVILYIVLIIFVRYVIFWFRAFPFLL